MLHGPPGGRSTAPAVAALASGSDVVERSGLGVMGLDQAARVLAVPVPARFLWLRSVPGATCSLAVEGDHGLGVNCQVRDMQFGGGG